MKNLILTLMLFQIVNLAIANNNNLNTEQPVKKSEQKEAVFLADTRYGHMVGYTEFGINIGIISIKVVRITCDNTPNVICVYKEGVPTSASLRREDGSLIHNGHLYGEDIEVETSGTSYNFYFYEE
jgi:hypothetical protein